MLDSSSYEINDTSSCGGFLKMILINSVDFVHRFRDISRFNIVRVIWKEVALENLSTNVGEKVARRWFASRFAAGACAGCAEQISRAFRVPVWWFLVSSTQMRLILYQLLSGRRVHISKLFLHRYTILLIRVLIAARTALSTLSRKMMLRWDECTVIIMSDYVSSSRDTAEVSFQGSFKKSCFNSKRNRSYEL